MNFSRIELMNFGILCSHFGTVNQCSVEPTVPVPFTTRSNFCRHFRKIGICFGNRPIVDFFHDQIIFLKDYELYTIGHSLVPGQTRTGRPIVPGQNIFLVPVSRFVPCPIPDFGYPGPSRPEF